MRQPRKPQMCSEHRSAPRPPQMCSPHRIAQMRGTDGQPIVLRFDEIATVVTAEDQDEDESP